MPRCARRPGARCRARSGRTPRSRVAADQREFLLDQLALRVRPARRPASVVRAPASSTMLRRCAVGRSTPAGHQLVRIFVVAGRTQRRSGSARRSAPISASRAGGYSDVRASSMSAQMPFAVRKQRVAGGSATVVLRRIAVTASCSARRRRTCMCTSLAGNQRDAVFACRCVCARVFKRRASVAVAMQFDGEPQRGRGNSRLRASAASSCGGWGEGRGCAVSAAEAAPVQAVVTSRDVDLRRGEGGWRGCLLQRRSRRLPSGSGTTARAAPWVPTVCSRSVRTSRYSPFSAAAPAAS